MKLFAISTDPIYLSATNEMRPTNLIYFTVAPKTVRELAGHENSKITMDIYVRVKYNKPEQFAALANNKSNFFNQKCIKPPESANFRELWRAGRYALPHAQHLYRFSFQFSNPVYTIPVLVKEVARYE